MKKKKMCYLHQGHAAERGGAIYVGTAGAALAARDVTFSSNSARRGGAVYVDAASAWAAEDVRLAANTAACGSGACARRRRRQLRLLRREEGVPQIDFLPTKVGGTVFYPPVSCDL